MVAAALHSTEQPYYFDTTILVAIMTPQRTLTEHAPTSHEHGRQLDIPLVRGLLPLRDLRGKLAIPLPLLSLPLVLVLPRLERRRLVYAHEHHKHRRHKRRMLPDRYRRDEAVGVQRRGESGEWAELYCGSSGRRSLHLLRCCYTSRGPGETAYAPCPRAPPGTSWSSPAARSRPCAARRARRGASSRARRTGPGAIAVWWVCWERDWLGFAEVVIVCLVRQRT